MVADRPDWCISAPASVGRAHPRVQCAKCGSTVANEQTFDAVIDLFYREGADAWFTREPSEYLPRGVKCETCGCTELTPEKDILDVWWESGVSHTSVVEASRGRGLRFPADMYLEAPTSTAAGSSRRCSLAWARTACRRTKPSCTAAHLDGEGRKMSKSLGNGVDPAEVMAKSGADVLRCGWPASITRRT